MAVRILTDSTCDIDFVKQKELGIDILPIKIRFGEEEYRDSIDLSKEDFFSKLRVCTALPTTVQVTPEEYLPYFESYMENGDEIFASFLSSKMSGTFQSAMIAKGMLGDKGKNIHLLDSGTVTAGLGALIYQAIRLRDEGKSAKEIYDILNEAKKRIVVYGIIEDLKYLYMGGRLSATQKVMGNLLGVKPIIDVRDGVIHTIGKARSMAKAYEFVAKQIKKRPFDENMAFCFGNTDAPDIMRTYIDYLSGEFPALPEHEILSIGPTVGTHIGPNCVATCFFEKEK